MLFKWMAWILGGVMGAALLLMVGLWSYLTFVHEEPMYIVDHDGALEGVAVQPAQAIELARPHLERATVVHREDKPLKLHVVRHKNRYHVMQTNYPAKAIRWYLRPAVTVDVNTGEVGFAPKE